jgi:hypothetical protein
MDTNKDFTEDTVRNFLFNLRTMTESLNRLLQKSFETNDPQIPFFYGNSDNEDISLWLEYFDVVTNKNYISQERKLDLLKIHLRSYAREVYNVLRDEEKQDIEIVKTKLKDEFFREKSITHLNEQLVLNRKNETESVQTYALRTRYLVRQRFSTTVTNIEELFIKFFIDGLPENIRIPLGAKAPKTFAYATEEAEALIRLQQLKPQLQEEKKLKDRNTVQTNSEGTPCHERQVKDVKQRIQFNDTYIHNNRRPRRYYKKEFKRNLKNAYLANASMV